MKIGILGGGQLGRMMALAGYPLGLRFRFLDPVPDAPAGHVGELVTGVYEDPETLRRFVDGLDLVTYEWENVPVDAARSLQEHVPVYPPPVALEVAQDRLVEKTFFQRLGIPTPPFAPVDDRAGLHDALAGIGLPAVLKTRRLGYDGKGQYVLQTPEDIEPAWSSLAGVPLILEGFIKFQRELSILAVRGTSGATTFYPLVENEHRHGMLRRSWAPTRMPSARLQAGAEAYAARALEAMSYVGLLAIELFECNGTLIANELAPRVHNSGHWTIEGAETSQFGNHLRAMLGLPLGATAVIDHIAMVNLIGTVPASAAVLSVPGAHLHLYGKQPRAERKLGHVTVRAADSGTLAKRVALIEGLLR